MRLLLVAAVLGASLAGCGDEPSPRPRPLVSLTLTAPRDAAVVREATAQVTGSVVPSSARVIVLGQRAAVNGGSFSARVDLHEGANIIDVGASAPGRRAVWRALRVTRRSTVRLPDVVGREADEARAILDDLGLAVTVTNDDDLIDAFRRGPRLVCLSDPSAGTLLRPGSEVELVVSRTC